MSCDFYSLSHDGIRQMAPYQGGKPIEELARELGLSKVVKLASNENPMGVSSNVRKACSDALASLGRYPDGSGFSLKQVLSNKLSVKPEQITLGCGSNDILDLLARVFLQVDNNAVISQHAFIVYKLAIQAANAQIVEIPAVAWGHDLDAMAAAIDKHTKLVFIANPNNPTGTYVNRQKLERFLDQVSANVIVVLDEAYGEYIDHADYPDGLELLEKYPNLVVTRTFSKAYGLAALRVGYSISNSDIAELLNRVRAPFNVNSLAMRAAEAALNDTDFLERSVAINTQGLLQLTEGVNCLGLKAIPSVGNFIAVDFSDNDTTSVYESLLAKGVIVRPLGVYDMSNYLRVSVGLPEENTVFLESLEQVLADG